MVRPVEPCDRLHAPSGGVSFARLTLGVFLVFQAADGAMTYGAAMLFGTIAEGNPIIVTWMHIVGVGPALLLAKVGASAAGILLYLRGVHAPLAGVTAFYAIAAVIPWLRIFSDPSW